MRSIIGSAIVSLTEINAHNFQTTLRRTELRNHMKYQLQYKEKSCHHISK